MTSPHTKGKYFSARRGGGGRYEFLLFSLFYCPDYSRFLRTVADSVYTAQRGETVAFRRRCESGITLRPPGVVKSEFGVELTCTRDGMTETRRR